MSYFEPDADLLAASDKALASINTARLLPASTTFEIHDPATEQVIAVLPDHTPADALTALAKADAAGKEWAKASPRATCAKTAAAAFTSSGPCLCTSRFRSMPGTSSVTR